MNLASHSISSAQCRFDGMIFESRLGQMISACEHSKNLMVGLYSIDKNRFLYFNSKLKQTMEGPLDTLIQNGWEYWYSLINQNEVAFVKKYLSRFLNFSSLNDRFMIRYHLTNLKGENMLLKHEVFLHKLEKYVIAVNYFYDVTEKEQIEQYFENTPDIRQRESKLNISARESEVLKLVGAGYSSKQIADKLFISNHTAITHRKNLIEKFQVKNTAHLIKRATELIPFF